ncbi:MULTISPECIES: hypothetical protein [Streptomyces]|uniref:Uncharacterized protein n=2 Tax=Streptomyces parvulus TaxID=146923 RepID=A0ABV5D6L0_9ACTN|nr:hypothetical protein [Streptomyces sp. VNUA74]WML78323.1 hypothetical protein Q3101_00085 [Streptomyces sp. VNUA74]
MNNGYRGTVLSKWRLTSRLGALAAAGLLAVMPLDPAHAEGAGMPATPTEQGIVGGGGVGCATDESAPGTVSSPQPLLTARVHGEAGTSQRADLRAGFTVDSRNADGSWVPVAGALAPSTGFVDDGRVVNATLTETLSPNTLYRMNAATWAYTDTQHTVSAATAFCYFTVDPTAPLAPKISYGGPYSECTSNDCSARGGAGVPGTFTFAPATGEDSPVVGYRYKFQTDDAWTVVSGSSVTITFTPPFRTFETLNVAARDVLGRYGANTTTSFKVA